MGFKWILFQSKLLKDSCSWGRIWGHVRDSVPILLLERDFSIPLNMRVTCQHVPDIIKSTLRSWHLGLHVGSVCCGAASRLFVGQWVQGRTCCTPWDGGDSLDRVAGRNPEGTELALLLWIFWYWRKQCRKWPLFWLRWCAFTVC